MTRVLMLTMLLGLWMSPLRAQDPSGDPARGDDSRDASATEATEPATKSGLKSDEASGARSTEALPSNALPLLDEYTGRNGIGLVLGAGSGVGLSYRRYLSDIIALRLAGYLFHLKDTATLYSLGLLGQIDFRRDERFVLYAVLGGSLNSADFQNGDETTGIFPAAGIGIELGNHGDVGLTYQLELALTGVIINSEARILLPLPQFGVHYVF